MELFPRTEVDGLSLSRMIIGTNWLLGYSHRSTSADQMIKERHSTVKTIEPMLETALSYGVDTIMAPFGGNDVLVRAVKETEQKMGKHIIMVDTPIIPVGDSREERLEAERIIKQCAANGSELCLIHHSSVEQLCSKLHKTMDRLPDYTKMIRDAGMIPGLSAHMPEMIVYSDLNEYDVQTYISIYNCMGFLMQVEVETVNQIIQDAKKPVMTIKPMAAGRTTPFVGLNFSWNTIRDKDMVTVGCFNEREVGEDIEISLAALNHRRANIEKRSSPNQNQDAFGQK